LSPSPLSLISPAQGSTYRLSPSFDAEAQRLPLEALAGPGLKEVTLWVDGTLVARLDSAPYQAWWTLSPGVHRAWVEGIDASGQHLVSQVVTFTVES
jgi:hypothetical protein